MQIKLAAPAEVTAQPRDSAVFLSWSEVEGADGYIIYFYKASQPERCIKKRYAKGHSKQLLGFTNGTEYLANICAFRYEKGAECLGEVSEKTLFVPISHTLKAQEVICLKVGELTTLKWESNNKIPMARFKSSDPAVASVGNGGIITAVSEGTARITVVADNQRYTTLVHVGRSRPAPDVHAVLLFTGDLMCAARHQRITAKRGYDFFDSFSDVKKLFASADYAVGVLETVCCDGAPYEHEKLRLDNGAPNCNSPSTFITAAADAGFNALVTANNHNCDAGYEGLEQTVAAIKRQGVANLGTFGDGLIMRVVRGIKVAFIACTMVRNRREKKDERLEEQRTVGFYSREYFSKLVNKAKEIGAEYIVAYQHWGGMNTRTLIGQQTEEAQYMADCGVDLIVGSHPHVLQELRYIDTADGRRVPCAFSLGNFLSSQYEMEENRDSIILRAELVRSKNGVSAAISYIPCYCFNATGGVTVRPIYPTFSERSREAMERIMMSVGRSVKPYCAKPKLLLSGSVILDRIFRSDSRFSIDKSALLLSQITACVGEGQTCDERKSVKLDIEKSFADYIKSCGADCIAVDFYAAASISCYRIGGNMYTGSKSFLDSAFYKKNINSAERVKPPFNSKLWKESIKRYADALLSVFSPERIILYRQRFPEKAVTGRELRLIAPHDRLNKRIAAMEDYFISLVNPAVVDLSRCYFNAGGSPAEFEREYFTDAANAAEKILVQGRSYIDRADPELWYDRMLRYYGSMTARGFQRWLLNMRCAADMLIAYTGESFAARHRERLLRLKRLGRSELSEVHAFFAGDSGAGELIDAAELINAVLSGDLSQDYDVYAPAFRENWNILLIMAKLLSAQLSAPVNAQSAELAFLLRGRPELLPKYFASLKKVTVDIWGSAMSKRIVDHCANVRVGRYVFGQCPLLANEALVPAAVPRDEMKFSGSSWRRQMTEEAFNRMGMFTLTGSGSKWLVIDFVDAIAQMNELSGGLFVVDEFLQNTDFYKEIKSQCTPCYLFEKRTMQQCQSALKRFTEDLSFRYGKNIILVRADLKDSFISLADRLEPLPEDKYLAIKRKFIAVCEKYFIDYTGCFVLDLAKSYHASDRHPEGAGSVNYEAEFYTRASEYISYCIDGGENRLFNKPDEAHVQIRDLRLNRDLQKFN